MTGTHECKIANSATVTDVALPPPSLESCFVVPQGHFFGNASAIPQGALLVNNLDIHYVLPAARTQVRNVSRSGSFAPCLNGAFVDLCLMVARPDLLIGSFNHFDQETLFFYRSYSKQPIV